MSSKGPNPELIFIRIFSALPLPLARALGAVIGWLLAVFPVNISRPKQNSAINIAQCFPEQPEAWRNKLVKQSLVETGKTISEFPYTWTRSMETQLKRLNKVHNVELFDKALENGKGVLLLAPHISNWEFLGIYLSNRQKLTVMYRESKNKALDQFVLEARQGLKMTPAPATMAGIKTCMKALKNNEVVAILPDHAPNSRNNPYAPFFGIPALTTSFIGQLYQKTKPEVLCIFAHRLPDNKYDIHFTKPDSQLFDEDQVSSATGLNKTVEQCVMVFPEQYNWPYKRFARRPEGQPRFYRTENLEAGNYRKHLNND